MGEPRVDADDGSGRGKVAMEWILSGGSSGVDLEKGGRGVWSGPIEDGNGLVPPRWE